MDGWMDTVFEGLDNMMDGFKEGWMDRQIDGLRD